MILAAELPKKDGKKQVKRVFKVIRIVVWILIGVFGLLYFSLNMPYVQRRLSNAASEALTEKLGVPVKIGKVSYSLFNRFVARDLYLEDQQGDTLFYAKKMGVNMDLWALTHNKLKINTAYLYGFQLNLNKVNPRTPTNLQFVIDAFAQQDTLKEKSFIEELELNSLILRKGTFKYDLLSEKPKIEGFDANHIAVNHISLNFAIKKISRDMIHLEINRLGFKEKSGFQVEKITAELISNEQYAALKAFRINLPNTILNFSSVKVDYSNVNIDQSFADYAQLEARLAPSIVTISDMKGFLPALERVKTKAQIQFAAKGTLNHLKLELLNLQAEEKLSLSCRGEVQELSNPKEAFIEGYVDQLELSSTVLHPFIVDLLPQNLMVHEMVQNAGNVAFEGNIKGLFTDFIAKGNLKTNLGELSVDTRLSVDTIKHKTTLKGSINTHQFHLGRLSKTFSDFGRIDLKMNIQALFAPHIHPNIQLKSTVQNLDYKATRWDKIELEATMHQTGYKGRIKLQDDRGNIDIEANYLKNNTIQDGRISIDISKFDLQQLQIKALKGLGELSFHLKGDAQGSSVDDVIGALSIKDLSVQGETKQLNINEITITSEKINGESNLFFQSPFLSAEIGGIVNWTKLPNDINHLLSLYLPTLANVQPLYTELYNDFRFYASIRNTSELATVFNFPFNIEETTTVSGMIHKQQKQVILNVDAPLVKVGTQTIQNTKINIANEGGVIASADLHAELTPTQGEPIILSIKSNAAMDILSTKLSWNIRNKINFEGSLESNCTFTKENEEPLEIALFLLPSTISINDTIWNFERSNLLFKHKHIAINHLGLISTDQHLKIDGNISESTADSLKMELQNISLDFVFDVLGLESIHLGGRASGNFVGKTLFKEMNVSTQNLHVQNFSVNHTTVGNLNATSHWDIPTKGILIHGKIQTPNNKITTADGGFYIAQDSMSLLFNAKSLNIAFLDKYLGTILVDMQGHASGNVRLFGRFATLKLAGAANLEDVSFGIDYLKTRYTVQDSIILTPRKIAFKEMAVTDGKGGKGIFNGEVRHRSFQNVRFDMNANVQNMNVLNTEQTDNPLFYGSIFGSGNVTLGGTDQEINIDVNMQSQPNSKFTFVLANNKTAGEASFISFKNKKADTLSLNQTHLIETQTPQKSSSKINMNLNLDVNRNIGIALIMDTNSGDMIKGVGAGNINIELSGNEEVKMYGRYTIETGNYNFSFQRIFNKSFSLEQGSYVTFNGNPLDADMNVKAMYNVSANLLDLDNSFSDVARSTVPVQCLLNIQGNIDRPTLSFDLNLPSNAEDINRRVKNLIGTEDMMNRQIIYLMMLGRFYTLGNVSTDVGNTNELGSIALSSTLSSQLNSLVRQFSSNWDIGTNLRWDDTSSDFEVTFSTQLNDRLKLQGNVGVQNDSKTNQTFIGDFLAEYSLNKAGTLFLKAYNKTNEKNYYEKSSLTTQGIGILFRKSFDSFNQILQKSDAVFERKKKTEPIDSIK